MGQPGPTDQAQHRPHQHQLHHGALQIAAGQAQVEAAIEQHQAHQQAYNGLEAAAQQLGLHQIKAGAADQQPNRQQQHHRRQAGEPRQQLSGRSGEEGFTPEQFQTIHGQGLAGACRLPCPLAKPGRRRVQGGQHRRRESATHLP